MSLTRDEVNGNIYASEICRKCPHPAVVKRFGHDGECNVSVFTCKGCDFSVRDKEEHILCGYKNGVGEMQ